MRRIKLHIEIEVDGKEADSLVENLQKLSDALTGGTKKTIAKVSVPKASPKKVVKAPAPSPKPTTKKTKNATASDADFIEAWQNSSGTAEVAQKLGINRTKVSPRAAMLRANGVELKKFKAGRRKAN